MTKLLESAELHRSDCVLEVGTGTGCLTSFLAERVGHVVTAEIDERLAAVARENLARFGNITLVCGDALAGKTAVAEPLLRAVVDGLASKNGSLKLVANLPYDIATPLVVDLLLGELPFERLCFTVQAEVAERFWARVGTAEYGPIGIVTQLLAAGERICRVPPQAFWPEPKVHSVMMRLERRSAADIPVADPVGFAGFVRSFFLHRRKSMAHLVKQREDAEQCRAALDHLTISGNSRPENVAPEQWADMYRAIC